MSTEEEATTTNTSTTTPVTEKDIADAAAAVDEATATSSTTSGSSTTDEDGHDEPKTATGMMAALKKHSDGTNVFKETIKTFSSAFGSDKKGDVLIDEINAAMTKLKGMIDEDKTKAKAKKAVKWEFKTSPHEQFGKTLDDTLLAFLLWAKSTEDEDDKKNKGETKEETKTMYNVSKAFRRLSSYAEWMEDSSEDLQEPLTADSVKVALKAWNMRSSIDKEGHFAWWIDIGTIDQDAVKKDIPPKESLRAFVWYSHYVMYDENAQQNGFVFVESCAKISFLKGMTLVPMKVGVKLDRLTIGVLPVKMKACYILESPTWMNVFAKLMGAFMSKKMKERMVILKDWTTIEDIVGKECVPKNFGKLEGSLEVDPVDAKYFS